MNKTSLDEREERLDVLSSELDDLLEEIRAREAFIHKVAVVAMTTMVLGIIAMLAMHFL